VTRPLPADFLIGTATAAHQVEGGLDNDWNAWATEHPELIRDGNAAGVAIDHYNRFHDDLRSLGSMGHNAHRFSVEWARVEPSPGIFDGEALSHYREVARSCRAAGMEPFVTLQHFTLPRWLSDRGGLLNRETPRLFARYTAACVEAFGDEVTWWLTVNEPAVVAVMSHLWGTWPPQRASVTALRGALRTLLLMHAAAHTAIRDVSRNHGWDARVSLAHHERPLLPRTASPLDAAAALLPNWMFNRWYIESVVRGRVLPPVGGGERVPGLADSLDYLGLNHYAHDVVQLDITAPRMLFAKVEADPDLPHNAFGWAIDPAGFRSVLNDLWRRYRLPIVVTENGVSDHNDELRPRFIVDHLNALLDAVDDGADVRGYLHWTAWDNYEWDQGYTQHFGLIAVDRETMERTPKPSCELYARICGDRSVPTPAP
jgi:beta-glucosidase